MSNNPHNKHRTKIKKLGSGGSHSFFHKKSESSGSFEEKRFHNKRNDFDKSNSIDNSKSSYSQDRERYPKRESSYSQDRERYPKRESSYSQDR
ncbi:MAG: hypothetical protein LC115_01900, partial [Bacteroidia bacterium]|nr:hypothetical protein [Bacteroidia bacterium]